MTRKRIVSTVLLVLFTVVILINMLYLTSSFSQVFSYSFLSGRPTYSGILSLFINPSLDFTIHNPSDGATYVFEPASGVLDGGIYEFPLTLLVSSPNNITEWNFSLFHDDYGTYDQTTFIPNITIYARVGLNTLTVGVTDNYSNTLTKSIDFTVEVDQTAPVIEFNDSFEIFACDGSSYTYLFNVTDLDDEGGHTVSVSPQNPFYGSYIGKLSAGLFRGSVNTLGFELEQSDVKTHNLTVTATDLFYSDSKNLLVTVLDVNKEPEIDDLGAQLIWNNGDASNFYYQWSADDVDEDGNLSDGVMNVTLQYQNGTSFSLFDINESTGIINFTADGSTPLGIYPIQICVTDTALLSPNVNLSLHCNTTGASNTVCDNFSFTVTDSNRAPEITNVFQNVSSLSITAKTSLLFNVTAYDPDVNPIDVEWYVAGTLVERNSYSWSPTYNYNDSFTFAFPCGAYGNRQVTVNVTDGQLYDTYTWNVSVSRGSCSTDGSPPPSGGGGGGGSSPFCFEEWVCPLWSTCLNVDTYFQSGLIDIFDYNDYRDKCNQLGYNSSTCGFQTRECEDLNQCKVNIIPTEKPGGEEQVCYYVENAGCFDRVKNCHSGDCELLVDCGGPCGPCPSCRDGIQNQGEAGIDCEGPCLDKCPYEEPAGINYFLLFLIFLLILLIIFIIYIIYRLVIFYFGKDKDEEEDEYGKPLRGGSRKKRIQGLLKKK